MQRRKKNASTIIPSTVIDAVRIWRRSWGSTFSCTPTMGWNNRAGGGVGMGYGDGMEHGGFVNDGHRMG